MTNAQTPDASDAARQAAEAIRTLNHLTLNGPQLSAPEISSVMQSLALLVDRLPQAFQQLAQQLAKRKDEDQVRMEDGRDPALPVAAVVKHLGGAAAICEAANAVQYGTPAGPLSSEVHEAASWLYNMGAPFDPDDFEDADDED